MGESLVETTKVEYQMGDTVTNASYLQQSVSFGRFEHDSLSWERWSTFPTNKYLEEVEKCSTPGSVARKKAYFEAHYKNIAARRAELLQEQEREREEEEEEEEEEDKFIDPDYSAPNTLAYNNTSKNELDNEKVNIENLATDIDQGGNQVGGFDGEVIVEHVLEDIDSDSLFGEENDVGNNNGEASVEYVHEKVNIENDSENLASDKNEVFDELKDGNNIVDEMNDVMISEGTKDISKPNDGGVVVDEVVVKEVIEYIDERDNPESRKHNEPDEELPQEKIKQTISEVESKDLTKLANQKKTQKVALVRKTPSTTHAKNKPASPLPKKIMANTPKSPMLSTPKSSKPEFSKVTKSTNHVLCKNENSVTPLNSKKTVPTSLHMSFSLESVNGGDQGSIARKSLIMERMGDKDIVKRAFKAFRNPPPQMTPPSSLVKPPATNQLASRKVESKGSPANALPKKNEGKAAKTAIAQTRQQVTKRTLSSPGIKKNVDVDLRNGKSVAVAFGPRVQLHPSNRKENSKKVEVKTRTNVLEATHMQSKVKVEKASEVKNVSLSQSINLKRKLSSSNTRGLGGSLRKENGPSKVVQVSS